MQLDSMPLEKGETVWALIKGHWKSGEVADINEAMKAVKVTYVHDLKKSVFKSDWFPVKDLTRSLK